MDITKAIEVLSDKIGISVREMLPHFTTFYFWSSICWLLFGMLLIVASAFMWRECKKSTKKRGYEDFGPMFFVAVLLLAMGLGWIAANIPGIISPAAEGYYHMLKSIGSIIHKQ